MLVFLKIFLSQGRTLRGRHITWHDHATLFATKQMKSDFRVRGLDITYASASRY